jgi:hypothetical protein
MRTKNLTRNAIRAGFDAYQAGLQRKGQRLHGSNDNGKDNGNDNDNGSWNNNGKGDPMAHLIDLYPRAKKGLMGASNPTDPSSSGQPAGPTAESCDGTHPLAQRHAQLGAMAAVAAAAAVSQSQPSLLLVSGERDGGMWPVKSSPGAHAHLLA